MSVLGKKLMNLHVFELDSEQWEKFQNFEDRISSIPKSFLLKTWKFDHEKDELQLISGKKTDSFKIGCSKEEWNYKIGSIKIVDHWLKARKFKKLGRPLNLDELTRIILLIFIIKETIHIKNLINEAFSKFG